MLILRVIKIYKIGYGYVSAHRLKPTSFHLVATFKNSAYRRESAQQSNISYKLNLQKQHCNSINQSIYFF